MNDKEYVFDELALGWDKKNKYIKNIQEGESERLLELATMHIEDKQSILDVGCGTGKVINHLLSLDKDISITGIDISDNMIDILKKKISHDNVTVSCNDVLDVEGEYDIILLQQVIHHMDNVDNVMLKLESMLKDNGKIILLTIGQEHMDQMIKYNDENDILCRYNAKKILSTLNNTKLIVQEFYNDKFKMEFCFNDDYIAFMKSVSLLPKMHGYSFTNLEETSELIRNEANKKFVISCNHITAVLGKNDDDTPNIVSVKKAYNKWSPNYNEVCSEKLENRGYSYGELAQFINKRCTHLDTKICALEIGTGTGLVASNLKILNEDIKITGVEISREMGLLIPSKTYDEFYFGPINKYVSSRLYDCIFSTFMLHHIADRKKYLEKVYTLLKNDGVLIIVDLMKENELVLNEAYQSQFHEYSAYSKYYTIDELISEVSSAKFVIEDVGILGEKIGMTHNFIVCKKNE